MGKFFPIKLRSSFLPSLWLVALKTIEACFPRSFFLPKLACARTWTKYSVTGSKLCNQKLVMVWKWESVLMWLVKFGRNSSVVIYRIQPTSCHSSGNYKPSSDILVKKLSRFFTWLYLYFSRVLWSGFYGNMFVLCIMWALKNWLLQKLF